MWSASHSFLLVYLSIYVYTYIQINIRIMFKWERKKYEFLSLSLYLSIQTRCITSETWHAAETSNKMSGVRGASPLISSACPTAWPGLDMSGKWSSLQPRAKKCRNKNNGGWTFSKSFVLWKSWRWKSSSFSPFVQYSWMHVIMQWAGVQRISHYITKRPSAGDKCLHFRAALWHLSFCCRVRTFFFCVYVSVCAHACGIISDSFFCLTVAFRIHIWGRNARLFISCVAFNRILDGCVCCIIDCIMIMNNLEDVIWRTRPCTLLCSTYWVITTLL